jgi:hypothetical protein
VAFGVLFLGGLVIVTMRGYIVEFEWGKGKRLRIRPHAKGRSRQGP